MQQVAILEFSELLNFLDDLLILFFPLLKETVNFYLSLLGHCGARPRFEVKPEVMVEAMEPRAAVRRALHEPVVLVSFQPHLAIWEDMWEQ